MLSGVILVVHTSLQTNFAYSLPSPSLLPTLFSPSLRRYFTGRTGVKRKRKRGQPSSSSATS